MMKLRGTGLFSFAFASCWFLTSAAATTEDGSGQQVAPSAQQAPMVASNGAPTIAGSAPPSGESASTAAALDFAARMSNVERINIRFPGLPTLSGEYQLNGDGTIAVPGIGRLKVGDTTISEFEAQLANDIQRISNRETKVAVEVISYRPIYVSGVVARAGAFPWRPGFTVLHAETLAGGIFRGQVVSGDVTVPVASTDGERERAVRSAYALAATLATITRLELEKSNDADYVLPPRVTTLISKREQKALATAQQATLKSNIIVYNATVAAAEAAQSIAAKEKAALEEQYSRIRDQLTNRRAMLKKIEYMTEHRYARGERLFEEQVRVAELEERLTTTTLAISRAEQAAAAASKQRDAVVFGRKADIDSQFLALEQRKSELEIAMDAASSIYRRATGQDAISTRIYDAAVPRYEIIRSVQGGSNVLKADRSTPLKPGDVVVVSFLRPDAS